MQLSFRLDKRPCESHLALDGKKWSLADRSKTQSKYKVKRKNRSNKQSRTLSKPKEAAAHPRIRHAYHPTPNKTNQQAQTTAETRQSPNTNHKTTYHCIGRTLGDNSAAYPGAQSPEHGMVECEVIDGAYFFPSGMADDALRLGPYMSVSR